MESEEDSKTALFGVYLGVLEVGILISDDLDSTKPPLTSLFLYFSE